MTRETGLSTRLGDFLNALDQVVDYAVSQKVDLVLLAGDAYKSRDPSQTQQREFARRLARLSGQGIPTFLLVGNHDLPNAVSRANAVEIFHTLQVPHIYVGDSLRTYNVHTNGGPLQVVAVPWPRRSSLLSKEESRGLSIEGVRHEIERRMTEATEREVQQLDPRAPAILTGHVTINGATVGPDPVVLGTERSMMLGQDHVLLASAVHRPQLEYVALGHIHKYQTVREESPRVVYSGSLQRVDFSEEEDQKGFCVIDMDPKAPQGQRMTDFNFQPVKARPFVTVEVKVPPGEAEPTNLVLRSIARQDVAEAVVRVSINLPSEMEGRLIRRADIREALKQAHFIASIHQEVEGTRRMRLEPGAADSLQPLQALRLYLESRDLDAKRREKILQYAEDLINQESQQSA